MCLAVMYSKPEKRFLVWSLATIIAVYVLILVGGIVRSTGSGMGCPDWPQCFGSWVPPASESELPADYAQQLTQKRLAKNQRFYAMLDKLGIPHDELSTEHTAAGEDIYFNPVKAWIEYLNRVVGVLIGIFIFLTLIFSIRLFRTHRRVTWLCLFTFLLVCFQGWLGSIVVSTNLFPGLITIHMLLALAIVLLLIYARLLVRGRREALKIRSEKTLKAIRIVTLVLMVITLLQIVLGTQVREMIDRIAEAYGYEFRDSWVARTGAVMNIHRDLAIAVLAVGFWGTLLVRRTFERESRLRQIFMGAFLLILLQILSGVILSRYSLYPAMQPVHLLVSCVIVGLHFYFVYGIFNKKISSTDRDS